MDMLNYIKELINTYKALRKFEEKGLKFEEESPEAKLLLKKDYIRWDKTRISIGNIAEENYRGTAVIKHPIWTPEGKKFRRHTRHLDRII